MGREQTGNKGEGKLTPEEIDRRVMAGRRDLHRWKREGGEDAAAQITAELGALTGLAEEARRIGRPEKALKIEALLARWR